MIAKTEEVEFQAFAFNTEFIGYVADGEFSPIGLPGFRADRGEFMALEIDKIAIFGMLIVESFKDFWIRLGESVESFSAKFFQIFYIGHGL